MSDICPAGKVRCEHFHGKNICGAISLQAYDLRGFEVCHLPSKQKIVASRFEKVYKSFESLWDNSNHIPLSTHVYSKKQLFEALKEAGFKDEEEKDV